MTTSKSWTVPRQYREWLRAWPEGDVRDGRTVLGSIGAKSLTLRTHSWAVLRMLVTHGYLTQGVKANGEKTDRYTRTAKAVPAVRPLKGPCTTPIFPWTVLEHWQLLTNSAYHAVLTIGMKLTGNDSPRLDYRTQRERLETPLLLVTVTDLEATRRMLERVFRGEPMRLTNGKTDWLATKSLRGKNACPEWLDITISTPHGLRQLCLEILIEPVFAGDTFTHFRALDPDAALAELETLVGMHLLPAAKYLAMYPATVSSNLDQPCTN